ncbi:hypothetical protein ACTGJ9_012050 [Bradyrhizobium sp. RDM12]
MTGLVFVLSSVCVHADDAALINKVKSTWRAQSGETAEQLFAKVSKVAHFVPRGWEVDKTGDGQEIVTFSWARHSNDRSGDEYTIFWELASDGTTTLAPPYAKPMELGWQPFALSLIGTEVTEEKRSRASAFCTISQTSTLLPPRKASLGTFLSLAGALSPMIRLQLATPRN